MTRVSKGVIERHELCLLMRWLYHWISRRWCHIPGARDASKWIEFIAWFQSDKRTGRRRSECHALVSNCSEYRAVKYADTAARFVFSCWMNIERETFDLLASLSVRSSFYRATVSLQLYRITRRLSLIGNYTRGRLRGNFIFERLFSSFSLAWQIAIFYTGDTRIARFSKFIAESIG